MAPLSTFEWIQIAVPLVVLIGAIWTFYTGLLPRKIKQLIGFYDLKDSVDSVQSATNQLKQRQDETMTELQNLKSGQVAIAETVNNEHRDDVDLARLREEHFGDQEEAHPSDFLSGDDD